MSDETQFKQVRTFVESRLMEITLIPVSGIEAPDVGRSMIINELKKIILAMDIIEHADLPENVSLISTRA